MELINREKLILDMMDRGVDHIQTDDLSEINQIIAEQEVVNRWIPVSERLPKVVDCYAVTKIIGSDLITSACFFDRINWHNDNQINHERNYLTNIVAWMPLPKPYRAESEE